VDHKKLFNKYPSSSSHAKIYVCLQLDLLKATSIYVRRARDKVSSVHSSWEVTTLKKIVLVLHRLLHSSANVGSCKASTLEILDIPKQETNEATKRQNELHHTRKDYCLLSNSKYLHPAATASWQGSTLYNLANPLYE
jgi:hypothetical protein